MYASLTQFALYGMYTLKRFNSRRFDDKLETIMFPICLNLTILPPRGSHWPSGICWLATNSSSAPAANMGAGVGTEKLKYRTVQMCRYIYTQ